MPARKIRAVLEREHVPYEVLPHATAYTAQETANAAHVPGSKFAKVCILEVDGSPVMAVLPAGRIVDLARIREILGAKTVELIPEARFRRLFPDCEPGAEPPFGNLYRMDVYADADLATNPTITFNAGTHCEAMRMSTTEWKRLVRPLIASFAILPKNEVRHDHAWSL